MGDGGGGVEGWRDGRMRDGGMDQFQTGLQQERWQGRTRNSENRLDSSSFKGSNLWTTILSYTQPQSRTLPTLIEMCPKILNGMKVCSGNQK